MEAETTHNVDKISVKSPPLTENRRNKIKFFTQESQSSAEYQNLFGRIRSPLWIKYLAEFLRHPKIDQNVVSVWLQNNPLLAPIDKIGRIRKMPKRFEEDAVHETWQRELMNLTKGINIPEEETTMPEISSAHIKDNLSAHCALSPKIELASSTNGAPVLQEPFPSFTDADTTTEREISLDQNHALGRKRRNNTFLLQLNTNSSKFPFVNPVGSNSKHTEAKIEEQEEESISDDSSVVTTKIPYIIKQEPMDIPEVGHSGLQQDCFINCSTSSAQQTSSSTQLVNVVLSDNNIFEPLTAEVVAENSMIETTNSNMDIEEEDSEIDVETYELESPPYEPIGQIGQNESGYSDPQNSQIFTYSLNGGKNGFLNRVNDQSTQQMDSEPLPSSSSSEENSYVLGALSNIENCFSNIETNLNYIMAYINRVSESH